MLGFICAKHCPILITLKIQTAKSQSIYEGWAMAAIDLTRGAQNYLDERTPLKQKTETHKTREHFITHPFLMRGSEREEEETNVLLQSKPASKISVCRRSRA